jgi:hypothetical protein
VIPCTLPVFPLRIVSRVSQGLESVLNRAVGMHLVVLGFSGYPVPDWVTSQECETQRPRGQVQASVVGEGYDVRTSPVARRMQRVR